MATVSERSPRKADVTVSSKWVSSGDWTGKKEVSVLGGGAFHFEGVGGKDFLLNSGQAPNSGRPEEQEHSEKRAKQAMSQEKKRRSP
jgi:hypothetical protein